MAQRDRATPTRDPRRTELSGPSALGATDLRCRSTAATPRARPRARPAALWAPIGGPYLLGRRIKISAYIRTGEAGSGPGLQRQERERLADSALGQPGLGAEWSRVPGCCQPSLGSVRAGTSDPTHPQTQDVGFRYLDIIQLAAATVLVHGARPRCSSTVLVHGARPRCLSMVLLVTCVDSGLYRAGFCCRKFLAFKGYPRLCRVSNSLTWAPAGFKFILTWRQVCERDAAGSSPWLPRTPGWGLLYHRLGLAAISAQSLPDAEVPSEALSFHGDATGAQVHLDDMRSTAHRRSTFHDGIVFSQRPVWPGERVALRVLRQEKGWCGGLRVGFTRLDPAHVAASCLPPFVCPDLEEQSPTWAALLPEGFVRAGNVVCFWVNRRGWL
ncbi:E3 ubiquitin-protein ligase NEURL3 [Alexandromys fortis]|uniref:E3 ubiquitin-protein ligase NEURL3 n=1 Tax=Alexandromys fortis TaxID=100897 RepID=UPI002153A4B2|nr:E3 ubiquitin-protein ligase NEURL3 [Microtus fortis]